MAEIDVILPTYNQKDFLSRAIEAILAQEFKDFLFIIVNDGSSDGTTEELNEKYANIDSRMIIIHNGKNKGLPSALNIGHAAGQSPYCTWVSTDNVSYPNQLKLLHENMVSGDYDFVQSAWQGIGNGPSKVVNSGKGKGTWGFGNLGPSFLYKRKVWETYHYDESAMTVEDLKFYLQARYHPFNFKVIDDCLVDYYYQPNSLTVKGNPKRRHREMMDEIYRIVVAPHGVKR